MHASHERLGVPLLEQLDKQPDSEDPKREANGRRQREGVHGGQADGAVGQRSVSAGRLFAVELVTIQLVWLAVLGASAWLLLH